MPLVTQTYSAACHAVKGCCMSDTLRRGCMPVVACKCSLERGRRNIGILRSLSVVHRLSLMKFWPGNSTLVLASHAWYPTVFARSAATPCHLQDQLSCSALIRFQARRSQHPAHSSDWDTDVTLLCLVFHLLLRVRVEAGQAWRSCRWLLMPGRPCSALGSPKS